VRHAGGQSISWMTNPRSDGTQEQRLEHANHTDIELAYLRSFILTSTSPRLAIIQRRRSRRSLILQSLVDVGP
jgi:hypothetical protein